MLNRIFSAAMMPTSLMVLIGLSQAVDIGLYTNRVFGDCDEYPPQYICVNIGENTCCSQGSGSTYYVTRFTGLPQYAGLYAYGVNFNSGGSSACGTSCNSAAGSASTVLCLSCPNTYQGALWVYPNPGKERRDAATIETNVGGQQPSCQSPDLGAIGGHYFNLKGAGSEVEALTALVNSGADYQDVPQYLLQYENATFT